uniref:VWFA domain-containing protein n=1 Tax=Panagrolaimus davidi TaxID=227884 RepID=A0A914PSS5_9BILA
MYFFVFVFLIVSLVPAQQSVVRNSSTDDPRSNAIGYSCSNETTQSWLDIVFVIDTSDAMSRRNFNALVGQIATFMQPFTFGQTEKHTIRVAVITYGINVVEQYLLTDTTNFENFIDFLFDLSFNLQFDENGANAQGALQEAYYLLLSESSFRNPLIILIAASYDKTGFNGADKTANAIKNNGIHILVINFASSDGVLTNALQKISSPGFYYVSNQDNINSLIPFSLTQINCFCPPGYIQFRYYNTPWKNYTNYAECLFGFSSDTLPTVATRVCKPGILVPITSQTKFDFIADHVLPHELPGKKKFTIGLHKSSSADEEWKWWGYNETEYSLGNYPSMFDIPNKGDNYGYFWNHYGFNWTLQTGNNLELPYICQLRACDAGFICDQTQAKKM